ncbi:MAG TPA: sulfatase-like hydrolase/transferase [Gemmatimonadales bacterium]|nr:sulfatase-like hydrolase/transferase [Gemmatimonadales bacterium]
MTALYPFLLAAARVLYQGWHSPGYFTLADLGIVLGFTLGLVLLVYLVAAAALPRAADRRLPAFYAFLAVCWLFGFPLAADALPNSPHHLAKIALGIAGVAVCGLLVRWLSRRPERLASTATFLTLVGSLLVARFGVGIAFERLHARRALEHSALARSLARPIPAPASVRGPARDIYLIVLDEYANADVLHDALGFDNRPFLDSLRALGFTLPTVGANYAHTMLALPTMLNAAHMAPLAQELGPANKDPSIPNALLASNRVARFLKQRGYRYIFMPSFWWLSTAEMPTADSVVHVLPGFNLDRELGRTEFRRTLVKASLLDYVHRDAAWDARFIRRTLEQAARLPEVREPVFAFIHVLSPHSPFVFDPQCRLPPRWNEGRRKLEAYIGQLPCLNRMVLATVRHLIRDSDVPPIILLQGDHGSATRGFTRAQAVDDLTPLAAWERLGAFGAYYLPGGGAEAFGDSVTVVNVMGNVLRYYFGAALPREPDERYLSVEGAPFEFRRASAVWLARNRFDSTTRFLAGSEQARR